MATSSLYPSCSLVLVLSLTTITSLFLPTNSAPADEICKRTAMPRLCLKSLVGEAYQNKTLDILAPIAIQKATSQAFHCRSKSKELFDKTTDPHLKASYAQCEKLFAGAMMSLTGARHDLQKGIMFNVYNKAEHVRSDVRRCEEAFKSLSEVYEEGVALTVYAEAVRVVAYILGTKN